MIAKRGYCFYFYIGKQNRMLERQKAYQLLETSYLYNGSPSSMLYSSIAITFKNEIYIRYLIDN